MNRKPPQTYGAIAPAPQVGFSDVHAVEFNNISDSIATNIHTINSSINVLEKALKVIGTKKDNHGIRNQVHVTQLSTNQIASVSTKEFKKLMLVAKKDKQRRLQLDRLEENFKAVIKRYYSLQEKVALKQKSHLLIPSESLEDAAADENEDMDKQIQIQKTRELAFEQDMLLERESRIRQIESDILDVNQIFGELASMVHLQADSIDTIQNSIDHTAGNVEEGTNQLKVSSNYQNKYRKKLLILAGIAVVCAIILIIVLVVELKK